MPPRVLHVVENLNRGAVENWLVRMLRHARARGVVLDWTFYCALGEPGLLDVTARKAGAEIVYSPARIGQKRAFVRALRNALSDGGYDVLHCHHDLVSALYLAAGFGLSVSRRIVHVHNADEAVLTPSRVKQRLYREPLRCANLVLADRIVSNSSHTLDTFLAGRARRPGRDIVHYYGIEPPTWTGHRRGGLRGELGLAEDALLLLFAGRMVPEKNPLFAVDVLAEMRKLNPLVAGVFVGSGSLDEAVRSRAEALDLSAHLRVLGWRNDVPDIMAQCDWFILPRPEKPMEGFGIAVVEAQLAGLRLLLSRGIADDPLLSTAIYRRLPLDAGAAVWARAARELWKGPAPSKKAACAALAASPMDMDRALERLMALHRCRKSSHEPRRA